MICYSMCGLFILLASVIGQVVGNEFKFVYIYESPNSIELTVIYDGYRIDAIKYGTYLEYMHIQHKDEDPSNSFMIQNLAPCIHYKFDAKVKNLETNQYFSHVENILTIPHDVILQTLPDLTYIYFEINFKYIACFESLNIVVDNSRIISYAHADLSSWLTIDDLSPCTNYNFVIFIKYQLESYKIYNQTVITKSIQFREVESINYDSSTTLLKWPNFLGDCTLKYLIIITLEMDLSALQPIIRESSKNEYKLDFLGGCSKYLITVTSENHRESSINITIATENKQPGPITNLKVALIDKTLLINWSPPVENPACIDHYNVLINKNDFNTKALEYTMIDYKPCKIYNLSVCPDNFPPTNCANYTFVSSEHEIIEIQNVTNIDLNTNTKEKLTTITWNVSNHEKHCIQYYEVRVYNELEQLKYQERTNESMINFAGLIACQNYRLEIEIFPNQQWATKIKSSFNFTIKPTIPDAPLPPELISKTTSSLTLKTRYANPHDECKIEMFQISCDGGSNFVRSVRDENGSGTIYNLKSFSYYDCSATVKNEMGWSNSSNVIKVFLERMRAYEFIQLHIHSVSSHSIEVSCSTHLYLNGKLNINKVESTKRIPKHCDFLKYSHSIAYTYSNTQSHTFEKLEPNTNYSVSLDGVANNTKYFQQIIVTTDPDVPFQVTNLKISHSSNRLVTLTWQLPCKLNGRINSFVGKMVEIAPFDLVESVYYWTLPYFDEMDDWDIFNHTEDRIKPEHSYNISVAIKLVNFVGPLNESKIEFISSIKYLESPIIVQSFDGILIISAIGATIVILLLLIGVTYYCCFGKQITKGDISGDDVPQ